MITTFWNGPTALCGRHGPLSGCARACVDIGKPLAREIGKIESSHVLFLSISFIASCEAGSETFPARAGRTEFADGRRRGPSGSTTTVRWGAGFPAEMTDTLDQLTD
jgi:hypothetical protein